MIGKICGVFCGYYSNIAIVDVKLGSCSIGYEISMKMSDILSLEIGETVIVYIKEIVKEDDDILYGFLDFEEKCFFEEFIKLSGLGPKIAVSILSAYSCDSIIEAINANNCDFFSSISGIGNKLANRIPNEMLKNIDKIREKVFTFCQIDNIKSKQNDDIQKTLLKIDENINKKIVKKRSSIVDNNSIACKYEDNKKFVEEAVDALVVLGFSKQQVYNDVFKIVKTMHKDATTEDIVKEFLMNKDK